MAFRASGLVSEAKPYFTTFNIADSAHGEIDAYILRVNYEQKRAFIERGRSLRRRAPVPNAQEKPRAGFPKRRERDPNKDSTRGVPFKGHLNRYKKVLTPQVTLGICAARCRTFILHATKGWKHYA